MKPSSSQRCAARYIIYIDIIDKSQTKYSILLVERNSKQYWTAVIELNWALMGMYVMRRPIARTTETAAGQKAAKK